MKKILFVFMFMVFLAGCNSITAKGEYGMIQLNDSSNYKTKKSNGLALGHKNPKNPHYNGGDADFVNIIFK